MKTFHIIFVSILGLLMTNCSTKVRSPICKDGVEQWPKEINGYFRTTLPMANGKRAKSIDFFDFVIFIKNKKIFLKYADAELGLGFGLSKNGDTLGEWTAGFDAICRADNGEYIAQMRNADGTYSLSHLVYSDKSFSLYPIGFKVSLLDSLKIKYYMIPAFETYVDNWRFDQPVSVNLIVENTNVKMERLLKASRTTQTSMHYVKIKAPVKRVNKKDWIAISFSH